MTDLPPDPLDELASAHLDGVTTPAEEARIAADPALQARVDTLRQVRAAIRDVPDASDEERTTTVAAVLARFDEGATVAPLVPPARAAGSRAWRIAAVAAAVVAVALTIPLLVHQSQGDSSQDSASSDVTSEASTSAGNGALDARAPEIAGDRPAATSTTGAGLADLGDYASVTELSSAVEQKRSTAAYSQETQADRVLSTCTRAGTAALGSARVAGRPVVVLLSTDGHQLVVLDAGSCALVATVDR